jgi:phosphopantetheinyl transferase/acyl-CoA thioesterase FadM
VIATDEQGIVRERISGYHLRILEEHPENPSAVEMANPEERDRSLLKEAVGKACDQFSLIPSSLELGYIPSLGSQELKQRRKRERPLIAKALATHLDKSPEDISFKLRTLTSGKPKLTVKDFPEIDLSISHDERYCLCAVGSEPQGCDIEVISDRSQSDWSALLSNRHSAVVEALVGKGDDRNSAGTRIWSATEAVRKAFNGTNPEFSLVKLQGDTGLLEATTATGKHLVLTLKISLTRSPARIVAFLVQPQTATPKVTPSQFDISKVDLGNATLEESVAAIVQPHHHLVDVTDDGPQGQRVYLQRFQVSFRQACSISRQVPVSQYISWVGKFREVPMISLAQPMLRDFYSGHYGLVTNKVTLKILGDATTYDTIQGRCWMGNLKDSSFDTYIEFCKVLPDHSLERVAMAEVKATWVKLLKYGVPAPDPLPDYLANYLKHFTVEEPASIDIKHAPTVTLPKLPEALANIDPGKVLYEVTPSPIRKDEIFSNAYQTTLEETNAVGNVYYGNYFIWQNRTLDLFFFEHIPEYYRVEQAKGEVLPLYSRMTYLKEGMPFDKIRANLHVDKVTEFGAVFQFRFFRENPDGSLVKLHRGKQEVVWVVRNEHGTPIPSAWPKRVLEALLQHSKTNHTVVS